MECESRWHHKKREKEDMLPLGDLVLNILFFFWTYFLWLGSQIAYCGLYSHSTNFKLQSVSGKSLFIYRVSVCIGQRDLLFNARDTLFTAFVLIQFLFSYVEVWNIIIFIYLVLSLNLYDLVRVVPCVNCNCFNTLNWLLKGFMLFCEYI